MSKKILILLLCFPFFASGQVLRYWDKVVVSNGKVAIYKQATTHQFSPLDIDSCVLWLKADAGITLNGSTVSEWADQSGNGNNATQSTAANQPTYVTDAGSGLNNKPTIRFITNDFFTLNPLIYNNISAFIVYKKSIAGTAGNLICDGTTSTYSGIFDYVNNTIYFNTTTYNAAINTGGIINYSTLSVIFNSSFNNVKSYLNGGIGSLGSCSGNIYFSSIGYWKYSNDYMSGDIAEIIIYNNALSAIQCQQVEQYLRTKYAHY